MLRFVSLRRRSDFTRLRQRGRRISSQALTIYRADAFPADPASLVGFAIGASIGKAVVRNTLRRRLKAILHEQLAGRRLRLLIVARPSAALAEFATLKVDLARAIA